MDILSALRNVVTGIKSWVNKKLEDKVDKIEGKSLSTNDFTNVEKSKIANLGTMANKSVVEKSDLSPLVQESLGKADTAIQSLNGYATEIYVTTHLGNTEVELRSEIATSKQEAIDTVLGKAVDTDFDTLQEVAQWIQNDTTNSTKLINRVGKLETDLNNNYYTTSDVDDIFGNYYTQEEIKDMFNMTNNTGTLDAGKIIEGS